MMGEDVFNEVNEMLAIFKADILSSYKESLSNYKESLLREVKELNKQK